MTSERKSTRNEPVGRVTRRCDPNSDLQQNHVSMRIVRREDTTEIKVYTLHKSSKNLTSRLQERMAHNDLQKLLQTRAAAFNHIVAESIRKDFAREGRNGHSSAFSLQNVAKVLKIGVAPPYYRSPQFEGRDVGPADNLVVRVHVPAHAMCPGIVHLQTEDWC